ncbi:MAG: CPBP family intramembrane metalloprotease [Alphaproteobacteria bacterium]|nr:CPBP family intramembrane metalloprotease [Alphaproteobacteria bacterium]
MSSPDTPSIKRITALRDLFLIIATLIVSKTVLLEIEAVWVYAGPISLILTFIVTTLLLRRSGQGWSAVGLRRPPSFVKLGLWTLVALVFGIVLDTLSQQLLPQILGIPDEATRAIDERYQGRFANLPGNLNVYLMWLALAWIIGGFIEELVFRGALISRFEQAFKGLPFAAILGVLVQAVIFGQQHLYYQGLAGAVATGAGAVLAGLIYLACKRNLWALILSHGLNNTLGLTVLYLGVQP